MGGHLRSGASVFVRGQRQGVVVGSHWLVVVSPRGWHRCVVAWPLWSRRRLVAMSPAATWHLWLVSVKRQGGFVLLTCPGHDLATIIIVVALWRALDGGGGWVAWSMVVVVGRKKQRRGNG